MGVELKLPAGWIERPPSGGPREMWAAPDGATGILQLSTLPPDQAEFVTKHPRLGELAMEIGKRLGWPATCASNEGPCAMGKFGFAVFKGGAYPAMFLWVTIGGDAAYLWTWLGPEPMSEAVKQAVNVVVTARA